MGGRPVGTMGAMGAAPISPNLPAPKNFVHGQRKRGSSRSGSRTGSRTGSFGNSASPMGGLDNS